MGWMIGVDIGGTFADFVALETGTGQVTTLKVLTTPTAPGEDVSTGLQRLAADGLELAAVERFVHGTTVGVNTIIQRRGARIALFTTAGFTDILELARLRMPNPYSLFCERPAPLIPRNLVFPIGERINAAGQVLRAPEAADVAAALAGARAAGCEGVVVAFLHAWRTPMHEDAVAAMIARLDPGMVVFRSSEVWPAIREYERTSTAVLNAYVHPRIADYLDRVAGKLEAVGIAAPLLLTTSAGGTMTARRGRRDCVGMLLSGTASGVVGGGRGGAGGGGAGGADAGYGWHQRGCGDPGGWRAVVFDRVDDRGVPTGDDDGGGDVFRAGRRLRGVDRWAGRVAGGA